MQVIPQMLSESPLNVNICPSANILRVFARVEILEYSIYEGWNVVWLGTSIAESRVRDYHMYREWSRYIDRVWLDTRLFYSPIGVLPHATCTDADLFHLSVHKRALVLPTYLDYVNMLSPTYGKRSVELKMQLLIGAQGLPFASFCLITGTRCKRASLLLYRTSTNRFAFLCYTGLHLPVDYSSFCSSVKLIRRQIHFSLFFFDRIK